MFGFSQKVIDPACGMKIDKNQAKYFSEYDGLKYYFCSENCKNKFNASPKNYVKKTATEDCCQNKTNTAKPKSCCG
jgi:P-type Cu+ transporter